MTQLQVRLQLSGLPADPTRRELLMSLAALPFLTSTFEAQAAAPPLCFMSALEMARLIRSKKLSAREALAAHLTQAAPPENILSS